MLNHADLLYLFLSHHLKNFSVLFIYFEEAANLLLISILNVDTVLLSNREQNKSNMLKTIKKMNLILFTK